MVTESRPGKPHFFFCHVALTSVERTANGLEAVKMNSGKHATRQSVARLSMHTCTFFPEKYLHEGSGEHCPSVERHVENEVLFAFDCTRSAVIVGVAVMAVDCSNHWVRGLVGCCHPVLLCC